MRTLEEIKRTVETGLGRFPCELKLANVQLVNVFSGEIYPTDIYIQNKRVVSIEPGLTLEAEKNVDCGGAYAVPGFIDSHMHFESTMLSPEALATVVVPQGTTTLVRRFDGNCQCGRRGRSADDADLHGPPALRRTLSA